MEYCWLLSDRLIGTRVYDEYVDYEPAIWIILKYIILSMLNMFYYYNLYNSIFFPTVVVLT